MKLEPFMAELIEELCPSEPQAVQAEMFSPREAKGEDCARPIDVTGVAEWSLRNARLHSFRGQALDMRKCPAPDQRLIREAAAAHARLREEEE